MTVSVFIFMQPAELQWVMQKIRVCSPAELVNKALLIGGWDKNKITWALYCLWGGVIWSYVRYVCETPSFTVKLSASAVNQGSKIGWQRESWQQPMTNSPYLKRSWHLKAVIKWNDQRHSVLHREVQYMCVRVCVCEREWGWWVSRGFAIKQYVHNYCLF